MTEVRYSLIVFRRSDESLAAELDLGLLPPEQLNAWVVLNEDDPLGIYWSYPIGGRPLEDLSAWLGLAIDEITFEYFLEGFGVE